MLLMIVKQVTGKTASSCPFYWILMRIICICRYGLECLFRFYTYGLEKHFRQEVLEDFENETLRDHDAGKSLCREDLVSLSCLGQLYGMEKFWAFLKYSRRKPKINPKLEEILKKYKRLEDFRVDGASFPQQFYPTKSGIIVKDIDCIYIFLFKLFSI